MRKLEIVALNSLLTYPVREFGYYIKTDGKTATSTYNGASTIVWDVPIDEKPGNSVVFEINSAAANVQNQFAIGFVNKDYDSFNTEMYYGSNSALAFTFMNGNMYMQGILGHRDFYGAYENSFYNPLNGVKV